MKKLKLENLTKATKINGETFVPILELCYMVLEDIYGDDIEENCSHMVEVYDENNNHEEFGVVTLYFDTEIKFILNFDDKWREFRLYADGSNLKLNQLKLFDQLREWNFNI